MTMPFRVQQIDHVEVFVPARDEAARWFEQVLGLRIMVEHQDWAVEGGPLMLSSDGGNTKVALFVGESRGTRPTAGHHRLAFRVDGKGFLTFWERAGDVPVFLDDLTPAAVLDPVDHDKSWSVYFCDPWGNRYEVTTYDYDFVSKNLAKGD